MQGSVGPFRPVVRFLRTLGGTRPFVVPPATARERREAYERDGFVAGGALLDAKELRTLRAEFDRIFAEGPHDGDERVAVGTEREFHKFCHLNRRSRAFEDVERNPRLVELLAELTGLDAFRVLLDQVQYKPPRVGGRNAWHRDMPSFPLLEPYTGLTAWIALDDATEHTGCLQMVPGSHRWGDAADLAVEGDGWGLPGVEALDGYQGHAVEIVKRPVEAGCVHFHHDMVWHASGRNGTRHKRRALAIHFVGADDRYSGGRRTKLAGLKDGDRLDLAAPLVVRLDRTPT